MSITKKEFIKFMNVIKEFRTESDNAIKAIKVLSDGYVFCTIGNNLLDSYIELLTKMMLDEECEWINYFVYECQMGENPLKVKTKNSKRYFKLDSVEKLWNILNEK